MAAGFLLSMSLVGEVGTRFGGVRLGLLRYLIERLGVGSSSSSIDDDDDLFSLSNGVSLRSRSILCALVSMRFGVLVTFLPASTPTLPVGVLDPRALSWLLSDRSSSTS